MLINPIKFINVNFTSQYETPLFPFKGGADVFEAPKIKEFEFSSNLSGSAKKQLMQQVCHIVENQQYIKPLGHGATGVVYQISGIDGLETDGVVVKISYLEDKNPATSEKQKVGYDYEDEIRILKQVQDLGENSQQYIGKIKLADGRHVLITSFVGGVEPDVMLAPMNEKALESILTTLQKLDGIGILHRDLKKENLVIDKSNKVKLIDFGEAVEFDILDFKQNDNHNFAPFEAPTNFQSFEDTFVSPYVDDLQKLNPKEAKQFFKQYLVLKSQLVFPERAKELQEFLNQNQAALTQDEIVQLERMIDYQKTMAQVLSVQNLTEQIVAIELMKNQVLYMSELAYKNEILLGNPLANVTLKTNALICAKKLESMILTQINRPNKPEVRKYLDYQLEGVKYRQQKIAGWLNGLVGWLTSCLMTDINTADQSRKKLIDECLKQNLEDFEIPNIAQGSN